MQLPRFPSCKFCDGRSQWSRGLKCVCVHSIAETAGSNNAAAMDVCLLWVLCVVRQRFLRRADHFPSGILSNVVCLSVIEEPDRGNLCPLGAVESRKMHYVITSFYWILDSACFLMDEITSDPGRSWASFLENNSKLILILKIKLFLTVATVISTAVITLKAISMVW
jgi:hypothetical protein